MCIMALLYIAVLFLSATFVICHPASIRDLHDLDSEENAEYGEHFEGDMLLTAKQREIILYQVTDPVDRNGVRNVSLRWPNRTIVYHINEDDFDEDQIQMIEEAIENIANKSCLQFRHRKHSSEHAVVIQGSESGCFSHVGFNDQENDEGKIDQVLNLSNGCFRIGTIIHEMLHTLGFYHMQSTYDRDDFVTILWENIKSGHKHNFKKYNDTIVTDFGVPYDYGSVMHYTGKAFSKNGNDTIVPKKENVEMGQREGMSESDILKLNMMYCEEQSTETTSNALTGSHDKDTDTILEYRA